MDVRWSLGLGPCLWQSDHHPSSLPACGLGWMALFPELSRPGSIGMGMGVGLRTLERAPGGGVTCGFPPLLLASVLWLSGATGP